MDRSRSLACALAGMVRVGAGCIGSPSSSILHGFVVTGDRAFAVGEENVFEATVCDWDRRSDEGRFMFNVTVGEGLALREGSWWNGTTTPGEVVRRDFHVTGLKSGNWTIGFLDRGYEFSFEVVVHGPESNLSRPLPEQSACGAATMTDNHRS